MDRTKTRSQGRRISKKESVDDPKREEILRACSELGLNPELVQKSYPRCWWELNWAVMLDKLQPKQQLLKRIAQRIAQLRQQTSR